MLTQHRTDPTLGPKGLDFLSEGKSAEETVAALVDDNETIGCGSCAIDSTGSSAFFHGEHVRPFRF